MGRPRSRIMHSGLDPEPKMGPERERKRGGEREKDRGGAFREREDAGAEKRGKKLSINRRSRTDRK